MKYTTLTALVAALALTAGGAEAQTPRQATESDAKVDVSAAIELEQRVEVAISNARWSEAAAMLREASSLRPENDPVGFSNLSAAGVLYSTIGRLDKARRAFVELANRAEQYGEVQTEAHALIDAAHAAKALGDYHSAAGYFDSAQRLAMSSHLSSQEVQTINNRLTEAPTVVADR